MCSLINVEEHVIESVERIGLIRYKNVQINIASDYEWVKYLKKLCGKKEIFSIYIAAVGH